MPRPSPQIVHIKGVGSVLSERSFVDLVCRRRLSQVDLCRLPGVTRKLLSTSREHYRPKYGAIIEAVHKLNLSKAAKARQDRSRGTLSRKPPSVLLDKEDLRTRLDKGTPVGTIARELGTSEWMVLRNCEVHGFTQDYITSRVLNDPQIQRLTEVFPYLDPRRPTPEALERALVELSRISLSLRRLGGAKGSLSAGEAFVAEALWSRKVEYIREHFVSDNISGPGNRRVDFYLPAFSTAIEVDGQHHADQKARDREVDALCLQRNLRLIRIPYRALTNSFMSEVNNALDSLHDRKHNPPRGAGRVGHHR